MDLLRDKDRRFFFRKLEQRHRITGNWGRQLPKIFVISSPNGLGEIDTCWVSYKCNDIV